MKEAEEQTREIETNQTRLSRLSEVSRRITESLDHGIALQEVVNGARSLADARYGVLEVFDQSGKVENSFGSGFSPGERRRTGSLPKRLELLEYLNQNQEPLRLADVSKHPLSAGFPENHPTVKTFLGVPIRHQGEPVGNIYVTDKEGDREFAAEDEDVLVTLASQAAMAIANIRRRTGEERAKGEVEAERQRLETLVMTSPVGVLVVEVGTLNIVSANQEMARITGEVLEPGRSLAEYRPNVTSRRLDGSDIPLDEMPLNRALNKGETVRAEEVVFSLRDGPPITTLCNTTPIYSEDGEIVGAVAVIQDMTPLAEMERLRSEFLGMVSHELRIPLTAIKGSSATVLGSSAPFDDSEMLQFFRIIDEQADRLRDLVSSLLDMTRIETGMFPITPKPTDVVGLVDETKNAFLRGGGRNRIEVDLALDLPPIEADSRRIVQVLNNLLSNASRYSPESSTIRVTASREDTHLAISVTDEGRGISADQLPRLFTKYSQIDSDEGEHKTAGYGLGLAICKGIVEAHGGRIRAESGGVGLGSRFAFTIPLAHGAASTARDHETPNVGPVVKLGERTRILVVDDEPLVLRYVRNTLTEAGYAPLGTGNPDDMMHLLDLESPHLILLDLVMPGTSGFELLKHIRDVSDVPVIFLSGHDKDEDIVKALEEGADDYIVKPFSPTELVARVEACLRRGGGYDKGEVRKPYQLGELTIDYADRSVTVSGTPVSLTSTEYRLLFQLSTNAGRILTHDQLLQRVWGSEYSNEAQLVRAFVRSLRRKLGDDARNPTYVFTEPHVGYRMAKP